MVCAKMHCFVFDTHTHTLYAIYQGFLQRAAVDQRASPAPGMPLSVRGAGPGCERDDLITRHLSTWNRSGRAPPALCAFFNRVDSYQYQVCGRQPVAIDCRGGWCVGVCVWGLWRSERETENGVRGTETQGCQGDGCQPSDESIHEWRFCKGPQMRI